MSAKVLLSQYEGFAQITKMVGPKEAYAGELITGVVTVENTGYQYARLYVYILDLDTSEVLSSKQYKPFIPDWRIQDFTVQFTMPNHTLHGRAVAGHQL